MALTPDRELDLLLNTGAWSVFGGGQLGVSSKLAFTNRLNTAVGEAPPGRITAPTGPATADLRSDTGQLRWNAAAAGKGLVTVDTPRTKALVGVADNQVVNVGGLAWKPGPTKLGWCTLGITLTRGEVFTNDCSALLVATGWWENTGQVWMDASKTSLGNQWGRSPVLAEVVPFTLTLPVGTNRVHVWFLDERGQRKAALPLTGDEQSSTLSVSSSAATLWYEIEVDRWMASFDLWRARYFSEAELTDPSVSGEAASPDGDSLPNLWKYYVGLPGRVAAGSERLPRGGWWSDGTRRYLAMFLTRDPLARDVDCQGAIAAEWPGWQVGAPFVSTESPNPAGDVEQVVIHDTSPATDHAQRFLQLRLQRR